MSNLHIRQLPTELGNGSDGALHIQVDTEMAQSEYNLTALTIDADCTWEPHKPVRGTSYQVADYIPIVTIRCLTPIVLNGTISMSGLTQIIALNNMNALGYGPAAFGHNILPAAYNYAGGGVGGGNPDPKVWDGNNTSLAGYDDDFIALHAEDEWIGGLPRHPFFEKWIGPNRPFRHGLGGIGAAGESSYFTIYGGRGGGHIEVYAPDIISGGTPGIFAVGEDGTEATFEDDPGFGGGGGGGGTVLLFTMALPRTMWFGTTNPGAGGYGDDGSGPGVTNQGGTGMYGFHDWRRIGC